MKKILFLNDFLNVFDKLSDEQAGKLIKAVFNSYFCGDPFETEDNVLNMAYHGIMYEISIESRERIGRVLDISQSEWLRLRTEVFERDKYTCRYCGKKTSEPECDHIKPFSFGGKSILSNLATACVSCNRKKGAKIVEGVGYPLV